MPAAVREVWARALTAEYASLTRAGAPITVPVTPYLGIEDRTLDVSTGLTYPAKAERARRDPRVCLLYADPVGAGRADPAVVLVQGLASVRDSDLQANTDRYVRESARKLPAATAGVPGFVLRRMAWYFARIWIEITPLHVRWWSNRDLEDPPQHWHAPPGTAGPLSDPVPSGGPPPAWLAAPTSWRAVAADAADRLRLHDLTVVDHNGFPMCLPVTGTERIDDGFVVALGPGAPAFEGGRGCLTMHGHPEVFTGQENRTFVGHVTVEAGGDGIRARLAVDRALADWSVTGNRARSAVGFLRTGRLLAPRLGKEAARRLQPVPRITLPPHPS